MVKKRRKHSDEFKARVALDAVHGVHTLNEPSARYSVHLMRLMGRQAVVPGPHTVPGCPAALLWGGFNQTPMTGKVLPM